MIGSNGSTGGLILGDFGTDSARNRREIRTVFGAEHTKVVASVDSFGSGSITNEADISAKNPCTLQCEGSIENAEFDFSESIFEISDGLVALFLEHVGQSMGGGWSRRFEL